MFAEDEARLLLAASSDPGERERLVRLRVDGLPLEHVLGWVEFCGLRVAVDPGVFVPRRRTELLVAETLARLPAGPTSRPVLVELCCGCGAVSAAVLDRLPGADVYAADLDPAAVRCAARNLPGQRVLVGDLYAPLPGRLRGRVEVVVANTPYVPSDAIALMPPEARLHEPRLALDGGSDGLDVQRRLAAGARDWLAPGGHLLVETSEEQAPVAAGIFAAAGLPATVVHDEDRNATVVVGTASAAQGRR